MNRHPRGYWTLEKAHREALKFEITAFREGSSRAYSSAKRYGWSKVVQSHMKPLANLKQRAIYAFEFEDNYVYVGLTWNYDERYKRHMGKSRVGVKSKQTNFVFKKFNIWYSPKEAKEKESEKIEEYSQNGWTLLNVSSGGELGSAHVKWTIGKLKVEADKYDSLKDFRANSFTAYGTAAKKGILNKICNYSGGNEKWTEEKIREDAGQYRFRADFKKHSPKAHAAANNMGISKGLFSERKPLKKKWSMDDVRMIARTYDRASDMIENDSGAYAAARRYKINKELFVK